MRCLVFGGTGMLGQAVVAEARSRGWAALGLSRAQADISDSERLLGWADSFHPDLVVNCAAFTKVDAILTPTSPVPPFHLGERTSDPLQMYLADIYTVTGSLAGVPGISVPCGKTPQENLPVGLQIFGPAFGEARVLQLAHAFEQAAGASL